MPPNLISEALRSWRQTRYASGLYTAPLGWPSEFTALTAEETVADVNMQVRDGSGRMLSCEWDPRRSKCSVTLGGERLALAQVRLPCDLSRSLTWGRLI
jgi:hypothetical protein